VLLQEVQEGLGLPHGFRLRRDDVHPRAVTPRVAELVLDISVPCSSCASPIGFPGLVCPSCGKVVPLPLREALEARLEASDEDFREAKAKIRSAATTLLVLALLHAGAGLLRFLVETSMGFQDAAEKAMAAANLIAYLGMGTVLFACYAWCARSPVRATAVGLGTWLTLQVAATIASPLSALPIGLSGFLVAFVRFAVLLLLVRGLVAALRAWSVMRRMAEKR
jgi:hypothetical protein